MNPVLEVRGLAKGFGGIRAVDGVSFDVHEGEILGLIGPNGSGKSTLFNCILGQLAPSAGEVRIDGRAITRTRPCELNRLGIGRTFQLLQVFPQLSVRENLLLAGQEHQGSMWSRLLGRRDAGLGAAADRMIEFFRLTAGSGYQNFSVMTATTYSAADADNGWFSGLDANGNGTTDLAFIKNHNAGSGHIEVFYSDGASGLQQRTFSTASRFSLADANNGWLQLGDKS